MAFYFDRHCRVVIEGKKSLFIENCKIKFEITKSSKPKENVGKIEIYNLSAQTRKIISSEDSLIRLLAGYSNYKGLVEVGQGDISKLRTNRSKTETVTEIYLAEGLKKIRNSPLTLSYTDNVKLSDILDNLASKTGFSFRLVNIDNYKVAQGGYADIGALDNILNNLSLKFNFTWSVQNSVILILGNINNNSAEIMVFSPESGLILNTETVKHVSRRLQKSSIVTQDISKYYIQVLLQPHLQVGDVIKIESQDLTGKFKIDKITHIGDTHGNDWYSNMEIIGL